jgi:hypothetical protein
VRRRAAPLSALLLLLGACGSCEQLAGPEAQIVRELQELGARASVDALPGSGELQISHARFDRLLVKPEGEGFVAVGTVDAEARHSSGAAVSYLGVERVAFRLAKRGWEPAGPLLPALGQVIELLLRRSRALEAGDEAALQALGAEADPVVMGRPRTVSAWTVRVDRDRAEVLEEYRLSGEGSGPGRRRLVLVKADREFRFDARLR